MEFLIIEGNSFDRLVLSENALDSRLDGLMSYIWFHLVIILMSDDLVQSQWSIQFWFQTNYPSGDLKARSMKIFTVLNANFGSSYCCVKAIVDHLLHRNSLDRAELVGGIGQGVTLDGDGSLQHNLDQRILL